MATSISGADSWLLLNGQPLSFQEGSENLEAAAIEYNSESRAGNTLEITSVAPRTLEIFAEGEQLKSAYLGYWEWRPPLGFAGLCELRVRASGFSEQVAKVRVLPEKLSQDHYRVMLDDLSTISIDLLIRLNSWASEKAVLQLRGQEASPLRDYRLMKEIINELEDVMFHIRRNPHRVLWERYEQRLFHEVHRFSGETLPIPGAIITLPTKMAAVLSLKTLPEVWMVQQSTLTYDVYENRLLRQFVQHQLIAKLHFIRERAGSELKRLEKDLTVATKMAWKGTKQRLNEEIERLLSVIAECEQMTHRCIVWASEPYLKSVKSVDVSGKATQILLKNPYYSRFFQLYLRYQQELTISLDTQHYLTDLAMQKVCDLYEAWSVFEITKMVLNELTQASFHIISNALFYEVERNYFQFRVRKNEPSIVLTKNDLRVEVKYEPIYKSAYHPSVVNTSALVTDSDDPDDQSTPDLAIEVYKQGQPKDVIIFDVKYRWQGAVGNRRANKDDLNKMREYADNIGYKPYDQNRSAQIQPIVSNAYILYPGDVLRQESHNKIGALPLVPDMDTSKRLNAENIIKSLLLSAHLI